MDVTVRILVCGSRTWTDAGLVHETLDSYSLQGAEPVVIIEGGARGADTLAGEEALRRGWAVEVFPVTDAMWRAQGRAAGPMRNEEMLRSGRPDLVLAFTDDLEGSKGTRSMVTLAVMARVPTVLVGHGMWRVLVPMNERKPLNTDRHP